MTEAFYSTLQNKAPQIEEWLETEWGERTPPLYLSCDIRHAGFKMGVVDTNFFPAGFNNLCSSFSRNTSKAFHDYLTSYHPKAEKILLLSEQHTRNKFYLKNLHVLKKLLEIAGREVCIGMMESPAPEGILHLNLEPESLSIAGLSRKGDLLSAHGFLPDLIISNNDFSTGFPEMLQGIEQPIIPSPLLGWYRRQKKEHFDFLEKVLTKFSGHFDLDPWFLMPYTELITPIDVMEPSGRAQLATAVEASLKKIEAKYKEYGIEEAPYVYLKSNRGTYGLGLLPVFSGEEVLNLNRRQKNKLTSSKGGQLVTEYLIQEGIPTVDFYSDFPIEPVIYAVGKKDVGGFFRLHELKNGRESLNAPGMSFSCLCLHKLDEPHEAIFLDCQSKERVVALARLLTRLAALGSALEYEHLSAHLTM